MARCSIRLSVWRVIAWRCVAVFGVGLLAYVLSGRLSVMWSAAYGGMAVLLPSAAMAWGVTAGRLSKCCRCLPRARWRR